MLNILLASLIMISLIEAFLFKIDFGFGRDVTVIVIFINIVINYCIFKSYNAVLIDFYATRNFLVETVLGNILFLTMTTFAMIKRFE